MATFGGEGGLGADSGLVRAPGNWAAIWGTFGFTLAIEGEVIQLATAPLGFPWNLISLFAYVVIGALTLRLFSRERFQKGLLGWKAGYENTPR
jgi:hypothetical protein